MIAGKVTAGKSRGRTEGEQMPTATSQKWNRAWPDSQIEAAAQSATRNARLCRPDQKRATEQQEYQPDIAHEMLIEGSGGCHAGNCHVPIGGRHKHEDAVRYHCDAEQHGYAETY